MLDLCELDSIWFPPLGALRVAEAGAIHDTHEWHRPIQAYNRTVPETH